MVFCPEHPKQDQNLNFTPLSETTSILASFIGEPPPPPPPLPQPPRIQHCKKTLHSWTKENRFVIQIQKTFWRKLEPLFNRNKKLYASKEVKENALASEHVRRQIWPTRNKNHSKSICVPWPLSVKQAAKITFSQWKCRTFWSINPAEEKNLLEQAAFWHEVKVVMAYHPLSLRLIHAIWAWCKMRL